MYRRACSQQQSNSQDGTIPQILTTMRIFNILNQLRCLKENYCAPNFDNIHSDEIHGLADSLLHSPLDLLLLLLREVSLGVATGRAVVSHGQLIVVFAGSVSHQMGVVGRGWVGHGPNNMHNMTAKPIFRQATCVHCLVLITTYVYNWQWFTTVKQIQSGSIQIHIVPCAPGVEMAEVIWQHLD